MYSRAFRPTMSIALTAVLLAVGSSLISAQESRRMVVTVDDLPAAPGNRPTAEEAQYITDALLKTFASFDVPAIGFVNEAKLFSGDEPEPVPERLRLLEQWLQAGLELGNHGAHHLDLHRVSPQEFEEDILAGEQILKTLTAGRDRRPRYFRHPFLHTGRSVAIRDRTTDFLAERGYRVAPVTIDNQEWIFALAYWETDQASEKKKLGSAYLSYMKEMVLYYEEQALAIVGEPIPQVLLIHANELNADWLDELLGWLDERDYDFVSLDEALEHPAYRREDTYEGPAGITWLHRWALTAEMDRSVFGKEPDIPDWLQPP